MEQCEAVEITRRTAETIDSNLADLRSAGLLPPRDRRSGCVTLAPAAEWGIGVVIERRRVVAMGFRVDCQTVPGRGPVERSIESDSDPAGIFERAADAVRGVMADEWTGRLLGVELAVPYRVDNDGVGRTRIAGLWRRQPRHRRARRNGRPPRRVSAGSDALGDAGAAPRSHRRTPPTRDTPARSAGTRTIERDAERPVRQLAGESVPSAHALALQHQPESEAIGNPNVDENGRGGPVGACFGPDFISGLLERFNSAQC